MVWRVEYNDVRVNAAMQKLRRFSRSRPTLMRELAADMADGVEESFQTETTPSGARFAALSPRYKRQRYRKGYTGPILSRTGVMGGSFQVQSDADSAAVGSNNQYLPHHQFGTRYMPARPVLGFGPYLKAQIVTTTIRHLRRLLR